MSYNLIPGKLYTTTAKDYPVIFEAINEYHLKTRFVVTQIYLDLDSTLLYTGKNYDRIYYEFLYHNKLIQIFELSFLILKEP